MATIETDRRVDAFVMNGHVYENNLEDYADLFQKIEAIDPSDRCLDQGERQLSLPTVTNINGRVHLVAYGSRDSTARGRCERGNDIDRLKRRIDQVVSAQLTSE